jgi:hypothetical protein
VIGGILAGTTRLTGGSRSWASSAAIIGGPILMAPQIVGIVLLMIGVHGRTRALASRQAGVGVELVPHGSPDGGGATLGITF